MIGQTFIYLILLINLLIRPSGTVSAQTPYDLYLSRYDEYRSALSLFKISKNEFDKFKTLTSRQDAIEKAKILLKIRGEVLIAYLEYLSGELAACEGLSESDRVLYDGLVSGELNFLKSHVQLIDAIASVNDIISVSGQLESHYGILRVSMRQTIIAIETARLISLETKFSMIEDSITAYISENRVSYSQDTINIAERWLLSIRNKKNLYARKIEQVRMENSGLSSIDTDELDLKAQAITRLLGEAKTDLIEAASYANELIIVLKYIK